MVNQKEHLRILLKNALEAIDVADIQRAKDLIQAAAAEVDIIEWENTDWNVFLDRSRGDRAYDKLLREFGW